MLRRAVHILGTSKAGRSPQVLGGTLASLTGGCGAGTGEATLFPAPSAGQRVPEVHNHEDLLWDLLGHWGR